MLDEKMDKLKKALEIGLKEMNESNLNIADMILIVRDTYGHSKTIKVTK
ncbi:hypothetical protein MUA68_14670 (plasmid) [Staphylococcus aureus]|nr:hypothetical protein [Staphylococcus aureus]UXV48998.1 hypothetical protein MUA24_14675 [Staphylococcus aureus]UXV54414.1 hypothetical protein MUA78_14475 [Staphylococcus aureus]UXV57087.1 hypothetical protein MUA68_14670 [Staphylococcus aureus]